MSKERVGRPVIHIVGAANSIGLLAQLVTAGISAPSVLSDECEALMKEADRDAHRDMPSRQRPPAEPLHGHKAVYNKSREKARNLRMSAPWRVEGKTDEG